MCNRGPYFKLCTCDPQNVGEYSWRLHRGSSFEDNWLMFVGNIAPPTDVVTDAFFDEESFIIDRILFDINNNPAFDFDYTPEEGDTLTLSIGPDIGLNLIFKNNQFEFLGGDTFAKHDGDDLGSGEIRYCR
jgi:hypothetical protein